ncbi:MAG: mechanosensitive ion channel family protein [Methanomicrobiales archaeon]
MVNIPNLLLFEIGYGDVIVLDIVMFLATLIVAVIIAKIAALYLRKAFHERVPKNDLELFIKVVYFVIVIIGLMAALPYLPVADLTGLLVAGGVIGIVIGFASQSVFSNLISGLFLIIERPIKIGDNVSVADVMGTVEDIHVISTIIKTYDGIFMRIPNEKVFTTVITNYVAHVARRFEYSVGIRYRDDADLAIRVIRDTIDMHPYALHSPAPSVFVDSLGDNAVIISVRIWAPSSVWWDVKTELLWKIKLALEENGISIPFPQRTVWFPEELRARRMGGEEGAEI